MFFRNGEHKQVWCKDDFYSAQSFAALRWGHPFFRTPVHLKTLSTIPCASYT